MKTIDRYLNELPEPERTLCLEARAKAKMRDPAGNHDAETADSLAHAVSAGFDWEKDRGDYDKFLAIHTRAKAGEFDKPAPKKMAADPLAERVEAMYTDLKTELRSISDQLDALRFGQYALAGRGNMKREPLLSDEQIASRVDEYILAYRTEITRVTKEFRDIYEAARSKDAELIQELLDALVQPMVDIDAPLEMMCKAKGAIELAYAAGFKPSEG